MNLTEQSHTQIKAINDILAERIRQDGKWGESNHDPSLWLVILNKKVGEASEATLRARFASDDDAASASLRDFRTEMVQVAAVALAIVECLDRGRWAWPPPAPVAWRDLCIMAKVDMPGGDLHGEDVLVQEIDMHGTATVVRFADVGRELNKPMEHHKPVPLHSLSIFDLTPSDAD